MPGRPLSPKAQGNAQRKEWLRARQLEGILLRQLDGVVYQTSSRRRIGVAFATERPNQPYKWFLGLPDQPYDAVVLLCQDDKGVTRDFVLPTDFLDSIWRILSRSGGQMKFHVEHNGSNYTLRIPGRSLRTIDPLLSNYKPLQ